MLTAFFVSVTKLENYQPYQYEENLIPPHYVGTLIGTAVVYAITIVIVVLGRVLGVIPRRRTL